MGHVKQKKSTSNNNSKPPETLSIAEVVNNKERPSTSEHRLSNLRDSSYPEQLNAEELISQINCRSTINEVSNDTNNNCNNNHNSRQPSNNQPARSQQVHFQSQSQPPTNRQQQQQQQQQQIENNVDEEDVENGPEKKHIRQRPLHRRLISYIRNLWIGARLNAGKDGKLNAHIATECFFPTNRFN
jgi:hypothetical protein